MKRLLYILTLITVLCGYLCFVMPEQDVSRRASSIETIKEDARLHANLSRLNELNLAQPKVHRNDNYLKIDQLNNKAASLIRLAASWRQAQNNLLQLPSLLLLLSKNIQVRAGPSIH